jgi:hypothetical protein
VTRGAKIIGNIVRKNLQDGINGMLGASSAVINNVASDNNAAGIAVAVTGGTDVDRSRAATLRSSPSRPRDAN